MCQERYHWTHLSHFEDHSSISSYPFRVDTFDPYLAGFIPALPRPSFEGWWFGNKLGGTQERLSTPGRMDGK